MTRVSLARESGASQLMLTPIAEEAPQPLAAAHQTTLGDCSAERDARIAALVVQVGTINKPDQIIQIIQFLVLVVSCIIRIIIFIIYNTVLCIVVPWLF